MRSVPFSWALLGAIVGCSSNQPMQLTATQAIRYKLDVLADDIASLQSRRDILQAPLSTDEVWAELAWPKSVAEYKAMLDWPINIVLKSSERRVVLVSTGSNDIDENGSGDDIVVELYFPVGGPCAYTMNYLKDSGVRGVIKKAYPAASKN